MANKKVSEKIILYGSILGGAYIIYKTFFGVREGEPKSEGSIGGSDEDLLGQQGFDIDPNVSYEQDYMYRDPIQDVTTDNALPETGDTSLPKKSPMFDPIIPFWRTSQLNTDTTKIPKDTSTPTSTDTSPTLTDYAIGGIGLTGTYATSFAKELTKRGDDVVDPLIKRTVKTGIEDIPFAGKKAGEFVFDMSSPTTKTLLKETGETATKQATESVLKTGLKQAGKTGIGLIPFIGIPAGMTFDIATNPEFKEQYEQGGWERIKVLAKTGTANIVGDVLGTLAVIGGGAVGVSQTGVGAVALGVGGQVAGEQGVYKGTDWLGNLFDDKDANIDKAQIVSNMLSPMNAPPKPDQSTTTKSSQYVSYSKIDPSLITQTQPSTTQSTKKKKSGGSSRSKRIKTTTKTVTGQSGKAKGKKVTIKVSSGFAKKMKQAGL